MGSAVAATQTEPTASDTAAADAKGTTTADNGAPGTAGRRRRRWKKKKTGHHPGDLRVERWGRLSDSSDSEEGPGPQRSVIEVDI